MSKPLRIGLVGLGYMGKLHLARWQKMDDVEVVAVCDADAGAIPESHRPFEWAVFTSIDNMLQSAYLELDAVDICSPSETHAEFAGKAVKRGLHVLVEKPMAMSSEECANVRGYLSVAPRELVYMVGHIERFNPAVYALMQNIELAGAVRLIEARRSGLNNPRFSVRANGVGMELASHDLDLMCAIYGGRPSWAQAIGRAGDADLLTGILRWPRGGIGTIAADWISPEKVRTLRVVGDKGTFLVDMVRRTTKFHPVGVDLSKWLDTSKGMFEDALDWELGHFVACIETGQQPWVGAQAGYNAVYATEALVESARQVGKGMILNG